MAAAAATTTAATFRVEVKRWHAVGVWSWGAGDDVCGICRSPFDGCPPEAKYPGDDSPVVWGTCGHAFHLQCIQKWLGSHAEQRCPMCRQPWEFKVADGGAGGGDGAMEDVQQQGQRQQQQQASPGG